MFFSIVRISPFSKIARFIPTLKDPSFGDSTKFDNNIIFAEKL